MFGPSDFNPRFSPDGKRLAFSMNIENTGVEGFRRAVTIYQ